MTHDDDAELDAEERGVFADFIRHTKHHYSNLTLSINFIVGLSSLSCRFPYGLEAREGVAFQRQTAAPYRHQLMLLFEIAMISCYLISVLQKAQVSSTE